MDLRIPPLTLGPTTKGVRCDQPVPAATFLSGRPGLLQGSFTFPVLTARDSALSHNIAQMARFAASNALQLAPHGKTSMAPALWQRQLAAGAWGMTVATGAQLLAAHSWGVPRILVANEVVDPAILAWISGQHSDKHSSQPSSRILFYIDSEDGLEIARRAAAPSGTATPSGTAALGGTATPLDTAAQRTEFEVLVELGHAGGRTGVRSVRGAVQLARAIRATPGVRLVGVSGYEGALASVDEARAFLTALMDLAGQVAAAGLIEAPVPVGSHAASPEASPGVNPEVIVSAGGSAYFDVVAEVMGGQEVAGRPVTALLRAGSYVAHDHGFYAEHTPFTRVAGELLPALRLWAQVLSLPEPGLALLGAGKRDLPFDEGLPVPLAAHRLGRGEGAEANTAGTDLSGWSMVRTNDQHSYLRAAPGAAPLRVGDVVELGISHPCTAFDKWRIVPVLDDDLRAIDMLETFF